MRHVQVVPFTECSMGMVPQYLNRTQLAPKKFVEKTCEQGTRTVPHVKMVPHCKNVTKQNCVTKWEMDDQARMIKFYSSIAINSQPSFSFTWIEIMITRM